jgi:hypothetical protein
MSPASTHPPCHAGRCAGITATTRWQLAGVGRGAAGSSCTPVVAARQLLACAVPHVLHPEHHLHVGLFLLHAHDGSVCNAANTSRALRADSRAALLCRARVADKSRAGCRPGPTALDPHDRRAQPRAQCGVVGHDAVPRHRAVVVYVAPAVPCDGIGAVCVGGQDTCWRQRLVAGADEHILAGPQRWWWWHRLRQLHHHVHVGAAGGGRQAVVMVVRSGGGGGGGGGGAGCGAGGAIAGRWRHAHGWLLGPKQPRPKHRGGHGQSQQRPPSLP